MAAASSLAVTTAGVESRAPAAEREFAPPPVPAFENERVREFEPKESRIADSAPSGPGYAPATPVRIEWPSDLQQVESDPEKVKMVEQDVVQEPSASRRKRVRQPLAPVKEEPLVQIETGQAADAGTGEKTPV